MQSSNALFPSDLSANPSDGLPTNWLNPDLWMSPGGGINPVSPQPSEPHVFVTENRQGETPTPQLHDYNSGALSNTQAQLEAMPDSKSYSIVSLTLAIKSLP
jgi:hypothetical protein